MLERAASSGVSAIPFTVTVAETTIARTQLAQAILLRSAIRLGLILAAAAAVIWFAVSASLAPLARLREAIGRRSSDDLRPIAHAVPREVEGLVATINSFMTRLEGALGALRHFTGNASHQLRTPLAIMRTQLELAQRAGSPEEARTAIAAADEAVVHAERILSQLLLLARIDEAASDRLDRTDVDLSELARIQTADHVLRARAAGIDLGFEGEDGVHVRGDPMLLGELLHNLIDNAIALCRRGRRGDECASAAGGTRDPRVRGQRPRHPGRAARTCGAASCGRGRQARREARPAGGREIAALFGGMLTLAVPAGGRGLLAGVDFPASPAPPPLSSPPDPLMSRRHAAAK